MNINPFNIMSDEDFLATWPLSPIPRSTPDSAEASRKITTSMLSVIDSPFSPSGCNLLSSFTDSPPTSPLPASLTACLSHSPVHLSSSTSSPSMLRKRSRIEGERHGSGYYSTIEKLEKTSPFFNKARSVSQACHVVYQGQRFSRTHNAQTTGHHAEIGFLTPDQATMIPGIPNDALILKFYTETALAEDQGLLAKEGVLYALNQYEQLKKDFATTTLPPYATIYNHDTLLKDGYCIQERVMPFTKAIIPWDASTSVEDLHPDYLQLLNSIKLLIHYSFTLKDMRGNLLPGLDLKWDNLGFRLDHPRQAVIFDMYEHDDPFYLIAKNALLDLSQRSSSIYAYFLDGLEEKCQGDECLLDQCAYLRNNGPLTTN